MKPNLISTWLQPGVADAEQRRAVSMVRRAAERGVHAASPCVTEGALELWALTANARRGGLKPVLLLALGCVLAGCAKQDVASADEKKSTEPESRVHRGTNGEVRITLDAATQKLMGLQVTPLAGTELSPEVKGYGRVLDPAALAAAVADSASAHAAAEASQKELARAKTLAEQNDTSTRTLEAAEAAAQRDQAQAGAAHARLLATAGRAMSERKDLAALVHALTTGESALVRIDLPAGERLKGEPTGARLVALGENTPVAEAKFVGVAPAVDPQTQAQGFLLLVEANTSRLVPGAALTGWLKLSGNAQAGILVPRDAVVRKDGATWIYLQTGEEKFSRVEITLGSPLADGWFVREGLKPQDKVVTVGAQQLLSEELKGQGGE